MILATHLDLDVQKVWHLIRFQFVLDEVFDSFYNHQIHFLRVGELIWTEIDDQSHYERALKEILPKLI